MTLTIRLIFVALVVRRISETLAAEWAIMTSNNQHPHSVDAASVYHLPVIKLGHRSSPLEVASETHSAPSEYRLIPSHTLQNHLQFLSLLNLSLSQGPQQANIPADQSNFNPLIASTTVRYPKIPVPPTKIEYSLEHPPKDGQTIGSQMSGAPEIDQSDGLAHDEESYDAINYFPVNPEPNDLTYYHVPPAPADQYPQLYADEAMPPSQMNSPDTTVQKVSTSSGATLDVSALNSFMSSMPTTFSAPLNSSESNVHNLPSSTIDPIQLTVPADHPGYQFISLFVDEGMPSSQMNSPDTTVQKLTANSDATLLDVSALNKFISSVSSTVPIPLNSAESNVQNAPSTTADPSSLAVPALNQFISSIPNAFPALQATVPDVTLNPIRPSYMIQLASTAQMAPAVVNFRNTSAPAANATPISTAPTHTAVVVRGSNATTTPETPQVGAPSTPTVALTAPLLSAIATIISDIAAAISAFVTSLANSGTFTTALNGILDFIISITLTPLCTATTDTQRAVVLLTSIIVAVAIIKLKKCEKKSCYQHYYRSLNEITVNKERVEEKMFRVMKMIQSLTEDKDLYR